LSSEATQNLIESYFGSDGIQYNVIRVPLAGTDFSIREYSYDDFENDFDLSNFSLSAEDLNWKVNSFND
jgi:glucosylceramidase